MCLVASAAAAVALAEAGADVVLAARTEDQLRVVAKQVEAAGRRAIVVPGDLTDFDLMASLAETACNEFGRLDIIVNNMGGTMPRPLLDTSPRFLEEAFRFNVSAGHALIRAGVPRMLEGDHPGGAIVSISSVMGHVAGRGYLGYGTVKGALEQYTRLASRDLAPRIRVNAIGVGSTATSALDIVMSSAELRTAMEDAWPGQLSLLCGPSTGHRHASVRQKELIGSAYVQQGNRTDPLPARKGGYGNLPRWEQPCRHRPVTVARGGCHRASGRLSAFPLMMFTRVDRLTRMRPAETLERERSDTSSGCWSATRSYASRCS